MKGKKDKQKLIRMTDEVADRFDKYSSEVKGDSNLTQDEVFEIMLQTCEEQRFANRHPSRTEEIQSFINDLERIKDKYKASLAMYDSVKNDTEQKCKAELQEKTKAISELVSERNNLKGSLKDIELQVKTLTEENLTLKEKIAKLEADVDEKDTHIKTFMENNEMAKMLTEAVKLMQTNPKEQKK